MTIVNMPVPEASLMRLIEALESGAENEIVLARDGKPAARIVPILPSSPVANRIGVAKGLFSAPGPDPALDAEIAG